MAAEVDERAAAGLTGVEEPGRQPPTTDGPVVRQPAADLRHLAEDARGEDLADRQRIAV
jgi:hypothetical protein